jgi:hypothetical protein
MFNAYYDPTVFWDVEYKGFANEKKIVVLQFSYNTDEEDLIKKYQQKSVTLTSTDAQTQDRLKRIVAFFARQKNASEKPKEKDGLGENYRREIEYIIGPHAHFYPPSKKGHIDNISINPSLIQLCVRCDWKEEMKSDLERFCLDEVIIVDVKDSEIKELGKLNLQ